MYETQITWWLLDIAYTIYHAAVTTSTSSYQHKFVQAPARLVYSLDARSRTYKQIIE